MKRKEALADAHHVSPVRMDDREVYFSSHVVILLLWNVCRVGFGRCDSWLRASRDPDDLWWYLVALPMLRCRRWSVCRALALLTDRPGRGLQYRASDDPALHKPVPICAPWSITTRAPQPLNELITLQHTLLVSASRYPQRRLHIPTTPQDLSNSISWQSLRIFIENKNLQVNSKFTQIRF